MVKSCQISLHKGVVVTNHCYTYHKTASVMPTESKGIHLLPLQELEYNRLLWPSSFIIHTYSLCPLFRTHTCILATNLCPNTGTCSNIVSYLGLNE